MNVNSKRIVFQQIRIFRACLDFTAMTCMFTVLIVLLQNIAYFYHRLSIGFLLKCKGNGQSIKIRELFG